MRRAGQDTALAVLTRSEKGSVIVSEGETDRRSPVDPVKVVDTTGAGDHVCGGVPIRHWRAATISTTAGRLGSFAAGEIIGHIGARPEARFSHLARMRGLIG